MDRAQAIEQIRKACKNIAVELMRIHPALPSLNDSNAQSDTIKALFEATKAIESIKKRMARLENSDAPPLT